MLRQKLSSLRIGIERFDSVHVTGLHDLRASGSVDARVRGCDACVVIRTLKDRFAMWVTLTQCEYIRNPRGSEHAHCNFHSTGSDR